MSSSRKPPAYLRYLKARLKPLAKPGFWLSSVGLLLVLAATGYYWQHPELLDALLNNQATDSDELTDEPTLSSEELAAIIADIDSSSVLLAEFDNTRALTTITQPSQKSEKKKSEGLFSQFISQPLKVDSKQKLTLPILGSKLPKQENNSNPFIKSTQELSNSGFVSGTNSLSNASAGSLQKNSQDSALFTSGTITNPIWNVNSPNGNALKPNQTEASVNPSQIPSTESSTAANEAQSSDQQQEQVSSQTSYPFSYSGETSSSPVPVKSPTNFPRSRPKPTISIDSNPYNSSVPSTSIPKVPTALPVTPVTPTAPGNYRQYSPQPSVQRNIVPEPKSTTFGDSGFGQSQLDNSGFGSPRK